MLPPVIRLVEASMSGLKVVATMPFFSGDEVQRPHCPDCDMRMITIREPTAKLECLRCGHTEPVAVD
jgi:hypothetical protein